MLDEDGSSLGRAGQQPPTLNLEEQVSGCRLTLDWQERGGLPVDKPERQGFRLVLLQRALGQLGGEAETIFAPGGLQVRINAMLPL
jgi:two-component sensor histidine kinase